LDRERSIRCFAALILSGALAGCAVPLAPGYKTVNETRTIRFVAGSPGELQIHEQFTLKNSGTTNLPYIDVTLPEEQEFGTRELRAELDGHETALDDLPAEYRLDHPHTRRITFPQPWDRGASHQLDIEYAFASPHEYGTRITIGAETFHLASLGWSALPQPPQHFLSPYPTRPGIMAYSVVVPPDFRVLARGRMAGRKQAGGETEYVFRLSKNDLAPFVVGGRYIETPLGQGSATVNFWTLHTIAGNPATTPKRISEAWATLESDFGPIDAGSGAPRVVESPHLTSPASGGSGPAVGSFPGGALVNEETLALGIGSDAFVEMVSHALAYNWFRDQMYPTGAASIAMGEGLPEYATIVIDEAAGGRDARLRRIDYFLDRYESAVTKSREKPLGVTVSTDTAGQRAIALAKAPLMYVDLEDVCGEKPVREGLKDLVTLLRGKEVGFDDMRSSIEQTCGKDLATFFRQWLYQKGLPADFRARYPVENHGPQ
jgi:hypothetical protein